MLRISFMVLLSLLLSFTAGSAIKIIVEAGEFDRENCIVSATIPQEALPRHVINPTLKSSDGKVIPLELGFAEPGNAGEQTKLRYWFTLPSLAKGTKAIFDFPGPPFSGKRVEGRREGRKAKVSGPNGPLLEYQAEPGELPRKDIREVFTRGGYI